MAAVKKATALSVVSTREVFRRAGRAFGKEATVIPLSELSKEEINLLKGEAILVVSEIEIDVVSEEKAAE